MSAKTKMIISLKTQGPNKKILKHEDKNKNNSEIYLRKRYFYRS